MTDVIIPVYRPGENFKKLLEMLSVQTEQIGKLILINTGEACWTQEAEALIRRLQEEENAIDQILLLHIKKEDFDHAATRRLGISYSDAEAFVCMTDDAVPEDGTLLFHLKSALYKNEPSLCGTVALAYARQLPRADCREAERFARQFNYPAESFTKGKDDIGRLGIKAYFASNVCCMYRRDLYDRLGGFVQDAIFNEDMLYAAKAVRAGYRIAYCAEARVVHSHCYSALQQLRRNFDLGMSQAMHPEVFAGIRSEGEGIRLVRETAVHLWRTGGRRQIPALFLQSAFKYAGFRLGRSYQRLPYGLCRKLAMNKQYLIRHRAELWTGK